MDKNLSIIEIEMENEYQKINNKWLKLHLKTSAGVVVFAFFIECIMGFALNQLDEINTTIPIYIIKYILAPLGLNLASILISYIALKSKHLSQNIKTYFISLSFVTICFVLFSVHSIFYSLYLIFSAPILLTIVYNSYVLTTVVAFFSIVSKMISELYVSWDPDKVTIWDNGIAFTNFIISLVILCGFYAICIVVIHFNREKNVIGIQKEIERHELKQMLQQDELTAINNRTALKNAFQNIEDDIMDNSYILAMIDIDNFKLLNDTFGHTKGDVCLQKFGTILKVHSGDAIPFRFGGDEFCILFKNEMMATVLNTCEKIQKEFKKMATQYYVNLPLSLSIGIAEHSDELSTTQLLKNTDTALYRSKALKNTISTFDTSIL